MGRPQCPSFLGDEAKREWHRQADQLEAAGILQKVDRAMLACYAEAWGEFVELSEKLQETGSLLTTTNGNVIQNPLVGMKNRAAARLVNLAQQFGFAPAARARVKAGADEGGAGGVMSRVRKFDRSASNVG